MIDQQARPDDEAEMSPRCQAREEGDGDLRPGRKEVSRPWFQDLRKRVPRAFRLPGPFLGGDGDTT